MRAIHSTGILVLACACLPSLLCGQEAAIRFGDATGQPGEEVSVAAFADLSHPLMTFQIPVQFDTERLVFLGLDTRDTDLATVDPLAVFHNELRPGEAFIGLNPQAREPSRDFRVPAGSGRTLGTVVFRIRADAPPGNAEVVPADHFPGVSLGLDVTGGMNETSVHPELLGGGPVTVEPPQGPRPVGDLRCVQIIAQIRLSFDLTETYDLLEVSRDGDVVATIDGTQSEYLDPLPGKGRLRYDVVALRAGSRSLSARCEVLATDPAPPAVTDLECGGDGSRLTWNNPITYDSLFVFRNGSQVGQLPGDAVSYVDPQASSELATYTVVAEAEGYRSPESTCIANGVWIMEAGDVLVPPDATRVVVPMYVTNPVITKAFAFFLEPEPLEELRLVENAQLALEGTVTHPESEFVAIGYGYHHGPAAGIGTDYFPPQDQYKKLPPGLRQHVFNFVFDVEPGTFQDGDVVPVRFFGGDFTIEHGVAVTAVIPQELLGGEIHFGTGELRAPKNLEAQLPEGGGGALDGHSSVQLSWSNPQLYESLKILRNGTLVATVSGTQTGFVDTQLPGGVYTYKVIGQHGARTSFPASTFLSTISPRGAFLRGDTNRDGKIDLSDPVTSLTFLFGWLTDLPCEDAADADDDGRLTITDPIHTLEYLFRGMGVITSPGTRYPWFDPTPDLLTCRE